MSPESICADTSHGAGSGLNEPQICSHLLKDNGEIPNNDSLPLLAYRGAVYLPSSDPAAIFETIFAANQWAECWRNGIFPFHHYHSTAHEVLGVYRGSAMVMLGGEDGVRLELEPGDVLIIPAGVGHKRLSSRGGLGVVGAYPSGQSPDMCRNNEREHQHRAANVARVSLPVLDPVYGLDGPLFDHWPRRTSAATTDHAAD